MESVLKRASQQKELEQINSEKAITSTRAYQLFSLGKTTLDVALALHLKADEAIEYHNEYCKLIQRDNLIQVYENLKGNVQPLVNLHRLTTAAGMATPEVIKLLKIAYNDLSIVESKFKALSRDVISLELEKQESNRILLELSERNTNLRERIEHNLVFMQEIMSEMDQLYQKKMKLEGLVRHFEYKNKTYLEIKKNIEQMVPGTSFDRKKLLRLALVCLIASIRNNPDKYASLLYMPSSPTTRDKDYGHYIHGELPSQTDYNEIIADMVLEDAEKLFNNLVKEFVERIIIEASKLASSFLPLLT